MKKIIMLIISLITIFSFTSCASKDIGGELKSIEKYESVIAPETKQIFNAKENTLDYEYSKIKNARGKMLIPYPKGWDLDMQTSALYTLKSPDDDPHMPSVTFYILYEYNNPSIEAEDIFSPIQYGITDTINGFKDQLKELPFSAGAYSFYRYDKTAPANLYFDPTIGAEHQNNMMIGENDNLKTKLDSSEASYIGKIYERNYYLIHEGNTCVFTFVADAAYKESISALQDYMVSNTKYYSDGITEVGTFTPIDDDLKISYSLPTQLTYSTYEDGQNNNSIFYQAGVNSESCLSGISADIYKMDKDVNQEDIDSDYADVFFNTAVMSSGKRIGATYYTENIENLSTHSHEEDDEVINEHTKIAGLETTHYMTTCTITQDVNAYFRKGDTWVMEMFKVKKNKDINIIVVTYPMNQGEVADEVINIIAKTAKSD